MAANDLNTESPEKPKVLVIYAHPESQSSVANQVMIKKITALDHVTVHDLMRITPTFLLMWMPSSSVYLLMM